MSQKTDIPQEARAVARMVSTGKPVLRQVSTEVKSVLPNRGDIIQEKTEQIKECMLNEIESRNVAKIVSEAIGENKPLRPVSTEVKSVMPTKDDVTQEKTEQLKEVVLQELEKQPLAAKRSLPVSLERQVLPSVSDIENEKKERQHREGIETFEQVQLSKIDPVEKVVLPSSQDIAIEKREVELRQSIEDFPADTLKPVQPCEKVCLPTAEEIAKEKKSSH